ncbi:MAG: 1-acyl-sn-glycerol-3-phosphate acyltransferase, partial [Gemmatimonas sp.]
APVLPIAVAGTRNAMAKGTFRFLRATALAQVLEPIDTAGMTLDDIGRLKQMARERIDAGRRALAAELGIAMPPVATESAATV